MDITGLSYFELEELAQRVHMSELPRDARIALLDKIDERREYLATPSLIEHAIVTDGDSDFD